MDDESLPEVECPSCGATIRARLADWEPGPHANYDVGVREELVDVLDTHLRLDDRSDAERVADALIGHPSLLRALATFSSGDDPRAGD